MLSTVEGFGRVFMVHGAVADSEGYKGGEITLFRRIFCLRFSDHGMFCMASKVFNTLPSAAYSDNASQFPFHISHIMLEISHSQT